MLTDLSLALDTQKDFKDHCDQLPEGKVDSKSLSEAFSRALWAISTSMSRCSLRAFGHPIRLRL